MRHRRIAADARQTLSLGVVSSAPNLVNVRPSEATASDLLRVIGIIDIAVAIAVILRPSPAVLAWASFWGAVTAASQMTAYGWGAYSELLVRSTHFLTPVALWLVVRESAREQWIRNADVANDV